jgi:hypothetical protein
MNALPLVGSSLIAAEKSLMASSYAPCATDSLPRLMNPFASVGSAAGVADEGEAEEQEREGRTGTHGCSSGGLGGDQCNPPATSVRDLASRNQIFDCRVVSNLSLTLNIVD